jgi:ribosomal-protein-alanine N-acetyltransferase
MIEVTIQSMRHEHIPTILEIEREAFTTPWTAEMFRQELEDDRLSRAYVAMDGDTLIGYCVAWFLRQEVHLINIAVAVAYQHQGVGSRVLRFLMDLAKREKRDIITLEVRESNEAAIEFYKSFGFTPIGIRPGYYQDDEEDALLMARYIPEWDDVV